MKVICFIVLQFIQIFGYPQKISSLTGSSLELCGRETEIELSSHGEFSSSFVTLLPSEQTHICKLRILAPKSHVVNIQILENNLGIRKGLFTNTTEKHPSCFMTIILPDNPLTPFWKGDLCSSNSLLPIDLLPPDFKIIWSPPRKLFHTKGRKIILTAVGQGIVCKEPGQHTCMRIGRNPMWCVSDYLLCDGHQNCPKSSTNSDEDEQTCQRHYLAQNSWEELAVEFFKKIKPQQDISDNKWMIDKNNEKISKKTSINWNDLNRSENLTTKSPLVTEEKQKTTDAISQMLAKYGPWGYLMLGLLICGTVLMFCGLWECCFKRPKEPVEQSLQTAPTAVLIINHPQGEISTSNQPPNYDDLDQPPSYTTLFPNFKTNVPNSSSSITRSDQTINNHLSSASTIHNGEVQNTDSNSVNT